YFIIFTIYSLPCHNFSGLGPLAGALRVNKQTKSSYLFRRIVYDKNINTTPELNRQRFQSLPPSSLIHNSSVQTPQLQSRLIRGISREPSVESINRVNSLSQSPNISNYQSPIPIDSPVPITIYGDEFPIEIYKPVPIDIEIEDIDGITKRISKKNNKKVKILLDQILDNGIWSLEVIFNNNMAGGSGIGILGTSQASNDYRAQLQNEDSLDGKMVRIEMNFNRGTLTYFYDGVQQPSYYKGITGWVHFVIYMSGAYSTCTIVSLKKLYAPTTKLLDLEIPVQF
ncbi:MAG: hypothetical protein EZS28_019927, partial [Streblomastix strix]